MRLIDADKLPVRKEYCVDEAGFGATFYVVGKEDIDNAPTIDAVPVVRCKDCEFMCPGYGCPVCMNWERKIVYDGWCYMGERREENAAD